MENKKTLTTNGMTIPHFLLILVALAMTGLSVYLFNYDVQTVYPLAQLGDSSSLCNNSGFFSCAKAVYSPVAFIFGIPIALAGILLGIFFLVGSIFPSRKLEGTNHLLALINAVGCFVLFLYSLIFLKGLCPFCTLFYISSWIAAFLFWRYSAEKKIDLKVFGIYVLIGIITIASYLFYIKGRKEEISKAAEPLLKQFASYPDLGNPTPESPYKIHKSTENFADAPIRISIFSDFQCPFCGKVATSMHNAIQRYKGKINIQYYFYPMDNECNSDMQNPMHQVACKAAYLAACVPENFTEVHDRLFEIGPDLEAKVLSDYAKKLGVETCYNDSKTRDKVVELINVARTFRIKATPTMLINGVKIEGMLPDLQLNIILDDLVKKAQK